MFPKAEFSFPKNGDDNKTTNPTRTVVTPNTSTMIPTVHHNHPTNRLNTNTISGVSQFLGRMTRRESKGSDNSSNSSSLPPHTSSSSSSWKLYGNMSMRTAAAAAAAAATSSSSTHSKMTKKYSQRDTQIPSSSLFENTNTLPLYTTFDFTTCGCCCCGSRRHNHHQHQQACIPTKENHQTWYQYIFCKCCNTCGSNPNNTTKHFLFYLAYKCTLPWNIIKFISSLILLFLSNIQYAWCPPTVDNAFNILYSLAFTFLVLDILRLAYFDSTYLPLQVWKWKNKSAQVEPDRFSTRTHGPWIRCGSFLFWCDVFSTGTLIYDISYFSSDMSAMLFIHIHTDTTGSVLNTSVLQRAKLIQLPFVVFVALARTARIARFLAPSSVQKISSLINGFCCFLLPLSSSCISHLNSCCYHGDSSTSPDKNHRMSPHIKTSYQNTCCHLSSLFTRKRLQDDSTIRRNSAATVIQNAWRGFKEVPVSEFGSEKNMDHIIEESMPQSVSTKSSKRGSIVARAFSSRQSLITSGFFPSSSLSSSDKSKSHTSTLAHETQVGTAMRDLTGQRVAFGILIAIIASIMFTYLEVDTTKPASVLYIHNLSFKNLDLGKFMLNSTYEQEDLIAFFFCNETSPAEHHLFHSKLDSQNCTPTNAINFINPSLITANMTMSLINQRRFLNEMSHVGHMGEMSVDVNLRHSEMLNITICTLVNDDTCIAGSQSYFDISAGTQALAAVSLIFTVFVLLLWFFAVTSFVGPLMILVVIPIERMIRLLRMMMKDPLGYQSSKRYKAFTLEENDLTKNTFWKKEVLKGMETNFLMSTIQRIGSLMRVGFGTAGVEIIRNSLERGGNNKDIIFKNLQGSSTSSIFMFCDIRGFTDATECLQEEIFAFTNRVAAVVHSYCNTYGGAANQNAGDAFLITWKLDTPDIPSSSKGMNMNSGMLRRFSTSIPSGQGQNVFKSSLVSSKQQADKALLACVKICMALQYDDFFLDTLSSSARKKLRDKVMSKRSGPIVQMGIGLHAGRAVQGAIGSQMKLDPTYVGTNVNFAEFLESSSKDYGVNIVMSHLFVQMLKPTLRVKCRKIDRICFEDEDVDDIIADLPSSEDKDVIELYTLDFDVVSVAQRKGSIGHFQVGETPTLSLPTGLSIYRDTVWRSQEFRGLFKRFDNDFFQRYNEGLNSYYARDWTRAQECFESLERDFNDGPSKYFLNLIKEHGKPPKNFASYRVVSY